MDFDAILDVVKSLVRKAAAVGVAAEAAIEAFQQKYNEKRGLAGSAGPVDTEVFSSLPPDFQDEVTDAVNELVEADQDQS